MTLRNDKYLAILEQIRWGGQPKCPYCESDNATAYKSEKRYHCNSCYTSFSVTVGTIFHKTHVSLDKWFLAIRLVMSSSGGISVRQLASEVGVNKNTAASMLKRIREGMKEEREMLERIAQIKSL
ncbi:IS1595 family transposase [Mastigocoleus sp. MO_188.B34]|uniref:IS1595 family transposase n=1 Tax=Mastigocoleus sp. MO_188.B34 TaxID=3036635 RepID=UPI002633A4C5|nr:IS1595 family transposase [Mastigocoleus sp. MO_188.B34]MDJ0696333.1 IS1595 family transposase [Mastigocoleus sp. MO_188.B34]